MSAATPTGDVEAVLARALPDLLIAEYGEDRATWTEMRSVRRIASALAAALRDAPQPEWGLPSCIHCGDPLVWHPGNGGQWLGAEPPRDWARCNGIPEGQKHEAPLASLAAPQPSGGALTDEEREARMSKLSGAAVAAAEEVWTEDEPTLAEYELAEAILRAAQPSAPVQRCEHGVPFTEHCGNCMVPDTPLPSAPVQTAAEGLAEDFAHRATVYEAHPEHDTDRYLDGFSSAMRVAEKIARAAALAQDREAGS